MAGKGRLVILLLMLTIYFPGAGSTVAAAAAATTVERVEVTVTAAAATPTRVITRMTASVTAVGEQMLTGRQVAAVDAGRDSYARLIREIFDRVLVGYSVEDVQIIAGPATRIEVSVVPWGDVVQDVAVETTWSGMAPDVVELVRKDMGGVEEQIRQSLIALPVEAVDWAGGVSKGIIREILMGQLSDFYPSIDISGGTHTVVRIAMVPAGPLIHEVNVELRSRSFPNLLLHSLRPAVEETAGGMRGLPVSFIERNREFFANRLLARAEQTGMTRHYSLQYAAEIHTGTVTEVIFKAETARLNITLEGWLDMGRTKDNTTVKLHAGQYLDKQNELFMEVKFVPSSVSWSFEPGWAHKLTPTTQAGVRYNLSEQHSKLWLHQYLGNRWLLRLERDTATGYNEFAIRYKLHELLSAEYVFTTDEKWLRLIGNL
ncbi:MAG TPA: hypothetical protein VN611_16460 [Patescibacteria group bacterium]|nr:hypothetical protein [Patescibacteria group bacterium]